jgi:peptidoglycan-associated lipoprotein
MTRQTQRVLVRGLLLLALVGLLAAGCATQPPKKEREDAEKAFQAAGLAEKCATITYQSGRQALDNARRLVTEKKYDEAKQYFIVAKNLFEQAAREAEANPDCLKDDGSEPDDGTRNVQTGSEFAGDPTDPRSADYDLTTIHFPFNSDELTDIAMGVLQRHAQWILLHTDAQVRVEGHCDERGSTEYNLSLGERRAAAVRDYLVSLGVNPDSLSLISYGNEKPLDTAHTEEAWAANRRAEFAKIWR